MAATTWDIPEPSEACRPPWTIVEARDEAEAPAKDRGRGFLASAWVVSHSSACV